MGPGVFGRHAALGQGQGQQLVDQHRPAAVGDLDRLHPARLGQFHKRDRLEHALARLAEVGRVGRLPGPPARAAHPLEERADAGRGLCLKHAVEIAHVDAQFERRSADDAGVGAVVKPLFGQLPLLARDGRVVHEHLRSRPPHELGHRLARRP